MSLPTVLGGSDTTPYTQSSTDNHRRKRNQSPPPFIEESPQSRSISLPETPVHQRRMLTQPGEWTGGSDATDGSAEKRVHWTNIPSPDNKKNKRPWFSLGRRNGTGSPRLSSGSSRTSARTKNLLTYLFFILMIGINIYIIAQSFFAMPDTRLMHLDGRKGKSSLESMVKGIERKSFELEQYYASRDSPMFCDLCPSGDEFCKDIGYQNIAASVLYEGANVRLHRVLRKLQNGEPISMGAIGGSVSAGHGLDQKGATDRREGPLNLHRRIFDYLTSKYPHPGHKFVNGALPATGSDYFATCFAEHIPEDVDLVTIELAINDMRNVQSQVEYEMLVRGLLALPNKPAIINVHTVGLMFDPISQGGDQHLSISYYYDIPTVSIRSVIMPLILADYRAAERFYVLNGKRDDSETWDDRIDYRHINIDGHHLLANLTTLYLERQFCKMAAIKTLAAEGSNPASHNGQWASTSDFDTVPKMMVTRQYFKENDVPALHPQCFSTISTLHPLEPVEAFGWEPWAWKDKKYLVARVPGAKATFAFKTEVGILKIFHQRSKKYGLGQVDCWVDDDVHRKKRVDSYWPYDFSLVGYTYIANDIAPGSHLLHCEVVVDTSDPGGGHEFRMTSLTAL